MKKVLIAVLAVMFMCGVASAMSLTGEMRAYKPVSTNTDSADLFNVSVHPQYDIEGNLTAKQGNFAGILKLESLEDVDTEISLTGDYMVNSNVGVSVKQEWHDMKSGRADYDLFKVGAVLKVDILK